MIKKLIINPYYMLKQCDIIIEVKGKIDNIETFQKELIDLVNKHEVKEGKNND